LREEYGKGREAEIEASDAERARVAGRNAACRYRGGLLGFFGTETEFF
jgi:hypothetical protein